MTYNYGLEVFLNFIFVTVLRFGLSVQTTLLLSRETKTSLADIVTDGIQMIVRQVLF